MKLLTIFVIANLVNVVIQTIKSIATIKCGKGVAAWVNGLAYGFYTYIVILMSADLPLLAKCFIIGGCNLVGVYVVKYFEEKARKDKLWKVDVRIPRCLIAKMYEDGYEGVQWQVTANLLDEFQIVTFYCYTQEETRQVRKDWIEKYGLKYCAVEGKEL